MENDGTNQELDSGGAKLSKEIFPSVPSLINEFSSTDLSSPSTPTRTNGIRSARTTVCPMMQHCSISSDHFAAVPATVSTTAIPKHSRGVGGLPFICSEPFVPHRGSLRRVYLNQHTLPAAAASILTPQVFDNEKNTMNKSDSDATNAAPASMSVYTISILVPSQPSFKYLSQSRHYRKEKTERSYELHFERHHYDFMSRLFSILDTESHGSVGQGPIREFVKLRCPVFGRRDNALRRVRYSAEKKGELLTNNKEVFGTNEKIGVIDAGDGSESQTFDEVWNSVVTCSSSSFSFKELENVEIGIEGWMVFCRFIALAQYQEARQRFSARHKQQTMRHRNGGRGSELVLVNVPPPDPPAPLRVLELVEHESVVKTGMALPELDLDHCLVSAHDTSRSIKASSGKVKICVFGSAKSSSASSSSSSQLTLDRKDVEFIVSYSPPETVEIAAEAVSSNINDIIVRRSFADMEWLHETFTFHKKIGGTLCGRILPPFPTRVGTVSSDYNEDSSSQQNKNTHKAIAVASAGMGIISSVAKSIWGGCIAQISGSSLPTIPGPGSKENKLNTMKKSSRKGYSSGKDSILETSSSKARQLERYLNYLLDHPALSTSFPLNTILKASQSGLESAKRMLEDHAKSKCHGKGGQYRNISESVNENPSSLLYSIFPQGMSATQHQISLSWVRTAAQAALALKLHGILNATGYQSASAKLQHASLPDFGACKAGQSLWSDDEIGDDTDLEPLAPHACSKQENQRSAGEDKEQFDSFETGVVNVKSELDKDGEGFGEGNGYDMLPEPTPLTERSALCAGSIRVSGPDNMICSVTKLPLVIENDDLLIDAPINKQGNKPVFHYGRKHLNSNANADESLAVLGDLSVDDDIDKLREVIRSVDNNLGRCLASIVGIGQARRKRAALHLGILRSLDSWEGMRGELISQRALLKGVSALEEGYEIANDNVVALSDDISWQASLASSAAAASEDVRSVVMATRTAADAKLTADAAVQSAQKSCDTGAFTNVDEARSAQTRLSIAQSHAIHAAVVEHEALTAKRRAVMALAHDVKCWNVHRKTELLQTCRETAIAQRESARLSANAWTELRDGLINISSFPVVVEKRDERLDKRDYEQMSERPTSIVCSESADSLEEEKPTELTVHVDHFALVHNAMPFSNTQTEAVVSEKVLDEIAECLDSSPFDYGMNEHLCVQSKTEKAADMSEPAAPLLVDIITPAPIDATGPTTVNAPKGSSNLSSKDTIGESLLVYLVETSNVQEFIKLDPITSTESVKNNPDSVATEARVCEEQDSKVTDVYAEHGRQVKGSHSLSQWASESFNRLLFAASDEELHEEAESNAISQNENMTNSMQSLVDGLLSWGGQSDPHDDPLPNGMAAAIALKESGILGENYSLLGTL